MDNSAYRQLVRTFIAEHITPQLAQWEQQGLYPLSLHHAAGAARVMSLGYEVDQVEDNVARRRILVEELTRTGSQAMVMALASHFVSLRALALGAPDIYRELSPRIYSAEKMLVLALTEPQAGSDLRSMTAECEQLESGEYRFTGSKQYICNGERADYLLTAARCQGKLTLFLIPTDQDAVSASRIHCMGWDSLPLASIRLESANAIRIGDIGQAGRLLQDILMQERFNLAVMALTSAELTFDEAFSFAQHRMIQGKPLFEQQVIRHRLAEFHAQLDMCRVYVDSYEQRLLTIGPDLKQVAIAKNQAVSILQDIATQSVQIHGAAGCMTGCIAEKVYRDAKLLGLGGGSTEVMNEVISRCIAQEREQIIEE